MDEGRTYYTYRITASDSEKYYYGVSHVKVRNASAEDCLTHPYWGSGVKTNQNKFHNWKKRHRGNLKKEIIALFSSKTEAYLHEKFLIGDLYKSDPLCLNSRSGGVESDGSFSRDLYYKAECSAHGFTTFQGIECRRCISERTFNFSDCSIHGNTSFQGDECKKCTSSRRVALGTCVIHGEVKFLDDECPKCKVQESLSKVYCEVQAIETWHSGKTCLPCSVSNVHKIKECVIHGPASFSGDSCKKCAGEKTYTLQECNFHGESNFKGGKCTRCETAKQFSEKVCPKHGLTKHPRNNCSKCTIEKANATRKARHGY